MISESVQFHFENDRLEMSQYPGWLNAIFFENILKKNRKNTSIKVRSVNIEPCGGANDGFLSELLRVNVNYIINSACPTESFVVKLLTKHELALEKAGAGGYDVQNKEMLFLEVVAPQMEKIFANIDGFGCVLPRLIAVDREHDAIVFEDLKSRGFVMADRMIGLDEKHVKLGLEKLAYFHAASLVLHRKRPKVFEPFDAGMFGRKVTAFNSAFLSIYGLPLRRSRHGQALRSMRINWIN